MGLLPDQTTSSALSFPVRSLGSALGFSLALEALFGLVAVGLYLALQPGEAQRLWLAARLGPSAAGGTAHYAALADSEAGGQVGDPARRAAVCFPYKWVSFCRVLCLQPAQWLR